MYVYIHIYIYVYAYVYVSIPTYLHMQKLKHQQPLIHARRKHLEIHRSSHLYAKAHILTNTQMKKHIHTYPQNERFKTKEIDTDIPKEINTNTSIIRKPHINTHIYIQSNKHSVLQTECYELNVHMKQRNRSINPSYCTNVLSIK